MHKKYVVRLTDEERGELQLVIKKLKGSGQKVRRAQILLKADADGPNWTDQHIAEAFSCRTRTVKGIRQRLVERGFQETLDRAQRPFAAYTARTLSAAIPCNTPALIDQPRADFVKWIGGRSGRTVRPNNSRSRF